VAFDEKSSASIGVNECIDLKEVGAGLERFSGRHSRDGKTTRNRIAKEPLTVR
jgi:hypothetical protein